MRRFLTRACAKTGRFFWSWDFLKFILWTITLIIFFYVEEDWRGARVWAATKAEWEAKGESFDYAKFIPSPIPDDQNLAAIPLFKLEPYSKTGSFSAPVALQKAMRSDLPGNDLPRTGNWPRGELPDLVKIRNGIATNYLAAFKDTKPPDDTLAQFKALYPFLTDFLADAAMRPLCRFNLDYAISPPADRSLGLLTAQIKLSKILTFHAILVLDHQQSDLALQDVKTNYELLSAATRDPTLVGGLVAIGMAAIGNATIWNGLTLHAWKDAQLVELQRILKSINFLADYQFDMRCEAAESETNLDYFKKLAHRSDLFGLFGMSYQGVPLTIKFAPPWPGGWWDKNKCQMATFLLNELTTVDPQSRRVFPKVDLDLQHQVEQARTKWDANAPWNIWFTIAAPALDTATQKYAIAQVWIDQARIACALERYRLAHDVFPDSLDALVPACIDDLPHDIMNGQPYHYQLRPDGTFLLYSVGWNQTDDDGKVVYKQDASMHVDYNEGDWCWPTAQIPMRVK